MHAIGEAARRSGVSIETIRYYERTGVVPLPARAASGRRLYDDAAIARLRFVKRCRELGFPLDDVRALLALSHGDSGVCSDVKCIGERHLHDLGARISDLKRLEAALAGLVDLCGQGRRDCPLLHELFAEGQPCRDGPASR